MPIYLISDTHFGGKKALEKFNRPFSSVKEMNNTLARRWNDKVSNSDRVIVVGDFAKSKEDAWKWLYSLNGKLILVDGNHRPIPRSCFEDSDLPLKEYHEIEKDGYSFYCAHKLGWFPDDLKGWRIHGHEHDKSLIEYPFLDPSNKKINVSAELLEYSPISLSRIIQLIKKGQLYDQAPSS